MADFVEAQFNPQKLSEFQYARFENLLREILPANKFYAEKFSKAKITPKDIQSFKDVAKLPYTTKEELQDDQKAHPQYGRNLTCPLEHYRRFHQTSGTTGQPLRWLDTAEGWNWVLDCWQKIYAIIKVRAEDRLFFPFSFGPFLGFWSAFEAAEKVGCLCLPGGGMSSLARLQFLLENEATVVLCTPTYALHLAEIAIKHNIKLAQSNVRVLIVAGEPGGSIPATRSRIEKAWGARVYDHSGMTEVGPLSVECNEAPGCLHILEGDYFVEVIDPGSNEPLPPGNTGELIVTNLGRLGSPLIRYRTGDLVKAATEPCPCGLPFVKLQGGILGRCDELIHIRGNNVYPSALEAIIRDFPEVAEFRIEVNETQALTDLKIEVEPFPGKDRKKLATEITDGIRDKLLFRAMVVAVAPGTLPRFELKAKRLVRKKSPAN